MKLSIESASENIKNHQSNVYHTFMFACLPRNISQTVGINHSFVSILRKDCSRYFVVLIPFDWVK